jgi:hypothetical protein
MGQSFLGINQLCSSRSVFRSFYSTVRLFAACCYLLGLENDPQCFLQGVGKPTLPVPDIPTVAGAGGRRQQQGRPAAPAGRPPQQLHPLAARHALETQQS